ncbi:MAG: CHAT domain-containing protein [Cyanobacteria bacterium J06649_11]
MSNLVYISFILLFIFSSPLRVLATEEHRSQCFKNKNLASNTNLLDQNRLDILLDRVEYIEIQLKALSNNIICSKNEITDAKTNQERKVLIEQLLELYRSLYDLTNQEEFLEKAFWHVEKSKSEELFTLAAEKRKEAINYEKRSSEDENQYVNLSILGRIQTYLDHEEALIEYFVGPQSIFAFVIESKRVRLVQLTESDSLDSLILHFREAITKHYSNSSFASVAYNLYTTVFKPLGSLPENLIIVLDGNLSAIPFGVLISEKPENPQAYSTLSYLIRLYQISYAFSSTNLLEREKAPNISSRFSNYLAFAPSFEKSNAEIGLGSLGAQLYSNSAEIMSSIQGTKFMGKEATKDKFIDLVEGYRIVHLSTHAKIDKENPQNSFIAFSNSYPFERRWKLSIEEIYKMKIPAELVVLSACETNSDLMTPGKGIISLARAFDHAGSRSIVSSLWNINDQTTTQLIADFYDQLQAGCAKDQALRNAKIKYIENSKNNFEAHPYYWAGMVITGTNEPIEIGKSIIAQDDNYIALILIVSLLLFIIKILQKRSKILF